MKREWKKLAAALLAVLTLALALAGCAAPAPEATQAPVDATPQTKPTEAPEGALTLEEILPHEGALSVMGVAWDAKEADVPQTQEALTIMDVEGLERLSFHPVYNFSDEGKLVEQRLVYEGKLDTLDTATFQNIAAALLEKLEGFYGEAKLVQGKDEDLTQPTVHNQCYYYFAGTGEETIATLHVEWDERVAPGYGVLSLLLTPAEGGTMPPYEDLVAMAEEQDPKDGYRSVVSGMLIANILKVETTLDDALLDEGKPAIFAVDWNGTEQELVPTFHGLSLDGLNDSMQRYYEFPTGDYRLAEPYERITLSDLPEAEGLGFGRAYGFNAETGALEFATFGLNDPAGYQEKNEPEHEDFRKLALAFLDKVESLYGEYTVISQHTLDDLKTLPVEEQLYLVAQIPEIGDSGKQAVIFVNWIPVNGEARYSLQVMVGATDSEYLNKVVDGAKK